jgi:hypothetical protein
MSWRDRKGVDGREEEAGREWMGERRRQEGSGWARGGGRKGVDG